MTIRVCIAGATGWAGSALVRGVVQSTDLQLVGAVGRRMAGQPVSNLVPEASSAIRFSTSVEEALRTPCDVFVEYTKADVAHGHVRQAIGRGTHVVIGSSGITTEQYRDIDTLARQCGVGVLAVGNFSILNNLLLQCAERVAAYVDRWELIDFASETKVDAPSGTARELAHRLTSYSQRQPPVAAEDTVGEPAARGVEIEGTRVHSVRLPGHVIGVEVQFGRAGERLVLRYDAGSSADVYVEGALRGIRRVHEWVGLRRGLDGILPAGRD